MKASLLFAFACGTLAAAVAGRALSGGASQREDSPTPATPLGAMVGAVRLRSLEGRTVGLREQLHGRPAVVVVMGPRECTSCLDLSREFRVLHERFPMLRTFVVGSGTDEKRFEAYFRAAHLEPVAFLDPSRSLVQALRVESEPLTLLADSGGRVLLVDTRPAPAAAQYPIGRILLDVSVALRMTGQ